MPKANDKDVYYFSHDCNARNDEKILALRSVHGLEGYAIYFMLIEILREQPTYRLPVTKFLYNTLAMQMQCECSKVESVVHDCCTEFVNETSALLKIEDGFLYSESLLRRMEKVDATSESRAAAANIRWEKERHSKSNTNAQQKQCNKKRIDDNKIEEKYMKEITDIISYLNEKSGRTFRLSTPSTVSHLKARLKDGYTVEQIKLVIDDKVAKWNNDPKMQEYIRPLTLFGAKFEGYLNAIIVNDIPDHNKPGGRNF